MQKDIKTWLNSNKLSIQFKGKKDQKKGKKLKCFKKNSPKKKSSFNGFLVKMFENTKNIIVNLDG